jgi:hypothetical protein
VDSAHGEPLFTGDFVLAQHEYGSFGARQTLTVGAGDYVISSISRAEAAGLTGASRLPISLKIIPR